MFFKHILSIFIASLVTLSDVVAFSEIKAALGASIPFSFKSSILSIKAVSTLLDVEPEMKISGVLRSSSRSFSDITSFSGNF